MALREHPRVAAKTRKFIQKEAARLGYLPDADLACLMAQIQGRKKKAYQANIALIPCPGETAGRIVVEGCRSRAGNLGYQIDLLETPGDDLDLLQILRARGIKATIFLGWPQTATPSQLTVLETVCQNMPGVVVNSCPQNLNVPTIVTDAFASIRKVFSVLMEIGYRRPSLFIPSGIDVSLNHAYTGAFLAMQQQLAASDQLAPQYFTPTPARLAEYLREQQPDCLLCHDASLLESLRKCGCLVPEDIGFVSLDLDAEQRRRGLAGIDQLYQVLGEAAVDVVVAQIHRSEPEASVNQKRLLIEGAWCHGKTIRRIR